MNKSITLIFPHQLFVDNSTLDMAREIFLVEDFLFFRQHRFHKQKLILHRASMQYFADDLKKKWYQVQIISSIYLRTRNSLGEILRKNWITDIHLRDVIDDRLMRDLNNMNITLHEYESPMFLTSRAEGAEFFNQRKWTRQYRMSDFYIWQRKRLDILIDEKWWPVGGQWSFDTENRKKVPKGICPPLESSPSQNSYVESAKISIKTDFPDNPGCSKGFFYGVTHSEATQVLENFIENSLAQFWDYEDAIVSKSHTLWHSVLSPYLNIGLITPQDVLDRVFEYYKNHPLPLNALEWFIRQIIGWREYIRIMYWVLGGKQRMMNFWEFKKNPLWKEWYTGETGDLVVDTTIQKILKTAYSHHIERLMVMGASMMMSRIHPDEVYRWFMEMYIDSYDWVMVPNIYGMSQYSDGGMMVTKPYLCGSNYILKMSDYPRGEWCDRWDTWYWDFIRDYREVFTHNPRMSMMVSLLEKRDISKKQNNG